MRSDTRYIFLFILLLNTFLIKNRDRTAAAEDAKKALLRGDRGAAAKAAVKAQRVPEHLRRRLAVALKEINCPVYMCRNMESDHAILASYVAGHIDFCLTGDLDFAVMARFIHTYLVYHPHLRLIF